jgi:hypothetical protein
MEGRGRESDLLQELIVVELIKKFPPLWSSEVHYVVRTSAPPHNESSTRPHSATFLIREIRFASAPHLRLSLYPDKILLWRLSLLIEVMLPEIRGPFIHYVKDLIFFLPYSFYESFRRRY